MERDLHHHLPGVGSASSAGHLRRAHRGLRLKYFFVGAVVMLVITRNVSWRRWFGAKPLTAKIAAIAFAVGWVAAVGALLFLV